MKHSGIFPLELLVPKVAKFAQEASIQSDRLDLRVG